MNITTKKNIEDSLIISEKLIVEQHNYDAFVNLLNASVGPNPQIKTLLESKAPWED